MERGSREVRLFTSKKVPILVDIFSCLFVSTPPTVVRRSKSNVRARLNDSFPVEIGEVYSIHELGLTRDDKIRPTVHLTVNDGVSQ